MSRLVQIALALGVVLAGTARAQTIPQTWVSGVGDDANPCTRIAPCLTFAGALALTDPGGEIAVLDPGDFGPVTIAKSVSIHGLDGRARIQTAGTDGITIAAGATDTVILRDLSILGDGTHTGVVFTSGGALSLVNVEVTGFQQGVDFAPTAAGGRLFVDGLITSDHGGAGLRVGGAAIVQRSRSEHNAIGFQAIAGGQLSLYDSVAAHNSVGGIFATIDAAGGDASINLEGAVASDNPVGVRAEAAAGTATVRMSKVLVTGNPTPTAISGSGAILTFGNNRIDVPAGIMLSSTADTQTVAQGEAATFPVGVAPTGLFVDPITFACTGLPAGAACEFTPSSSLPGNMSGMVSVKVTTGPTLFGRLVRHGGPSMACALVLLLAFTGRRRRFARALLVCVLLGVGLTVAACGDHLEAPADMAANDQSPDDMTPAGLVEPGTYSITVTATSGAVTGSLPLTLIVH